MKYPFFFYKTKWFKNMKKSFLIAASSVLLTLTGCASYNASPLNMLSTEMMLSHSDPDVKNSNLLVVAKSFSKEDCERYLDRDVIRKGYQPVQLFIQNNSNKDYHFSLNRISMPSAKPDEVAKKVHTNTAGRATGYAVAGLLTSGLLFIPAIVDGIGSANANEALDYDFSTKVAQDQTIYSHSHFNKLLFVPVSAYEQILSITLIDKETSLPETIKVYID